MLQLAAAGQADIARSWMVAFVDTIQGIATLIPPLAKEPNHMQDSLTVKYPN